MLAPEASLPALLRNRGGSTDSLLEGVGFEPSRGPTVIDPTSLTGPALCLTPGLEPIEVFDTPDLKEATALLTCRYRAIRRASSENEQ
jgi:hypothetical protein